jgi:hypothetical protein
MKFHLTFKTPDVLDQLTHDHETDAQEKARMFALKFLKYEEYLTVEFDTDEKTATVLEVK